MAVWHRDVWGPAVWAPGVWEGMDQAAPTVPQGRMLRDLRRERLEEALRRSRALTRSPLGVAQLLVGCGLIR